MGQYTIRIEKDGTTIAKDINGYGSECQNVTRDLFAKLGQVKSQELTDEYYEGDETRLDQQLGD